MSSNKIQNALLDSFLWKLNAAQSIAIWVKAAHYALPCSRKWLIASKMWVHWAVCSCCSRRQVMLTLSCARPRNAKKIPAELNFYRLPDWALTPLYLARPSGTWQWRKSAQPQTKVGLLLKTAAHAHAGPLRPRNAWKIPSSLNFYWLLANSLSIERSATQFQLIGRADWFLRLNLKIALGLQVFFSSCCCNKTVSNV